MAQAGEDDLYEFLWLDPDKSVYVLQNKIYPKNKTFYLDLGYVTSMTSTFQDSFGGQLKFGYYFSEEWAIEGNYLQYTNTDNASYDNVKSLNGQVPFVRRPLSSTTINLIWTPFYGKINTFNQIYYFDVSFGVGTGQYTAESNLDTVIEENSKDSYSTETYTPVALKTNMKFHINKNMHVGIEFLSTNYKAKTDPQNTKKEAWKRNNDLIFSFGVSF
tara:strand:+ start:991 stop:1641 length:651 start_codon:yes stop_codon:yes gene_type:complete